MTEADILSFRYISVKSRIKTVIKESEKIEKQTKELMEQFRQENKELREENLLLIKQLGNNIDY